jgi:nitroreductase
MQKTALTQVEINPLIAARWSPRAYDANKPVMQAQIIALLEAARWAPSCFGDQPWRFIVWDKNTDPASWQQAFDCIVPNNQVWVKDAPVLILACADTLFSHNQSPNRWAQYDTGAAVENLCLQASSMGLVAHQMGGFNSDKTRQAFSIPEQYVPMAMLTVGYEGDADNLPEDLKQRELAPRKRNELGALFFSQVWGKPVV